MHHVRLGLWTRRFADSLPTVAVVFASFASYANNAVHGLRAKMHSGIFLKGHGDV
jgi:hypothetical protein